MKRQQGVALITVLLVVAIVTIVGNADRIVDAARAVAGFRMAEPPPWLANVPMVGAWLVDLWGQAEAAGIPRERIAVDPGIGFGKTLDHNLSLFKHMEALYRLGRPLLVGVSRKSMIGLTLERPVGERLYGSLALAALAMTKGASILRVHDVAETVDVVRMIAAVQSAE